MSKVLDEILSYLSTVTNEQKRKDWETLEPYSHVGPRARDFIDDCLGTFSYFSKNVEANKLTHIEDPELYSGSFLII